MHEQGQGSQGSWVPAFSKVTELLYAEVKQSDVLTTGSGGQSLW